MHQELRTLLNEISKHNKPLSEAVASIYTAIYEAGDVSGGSEPAVKSTDTKEALVSKVGENPMQVTDGNVDGLAEKNGLDDTSSNKNAKEIQKIEQDQTQLDLSNPDAFALPTEDELPQSALPSETPPTEEQPSEEPEIPEDPDAPLTEDEMASSGPVIKDNLNKDALNDLDFSKIDDGGDKDQQ